MKLAFMFLLMSTPAFAQNGSVPASCGPADVHFSVKPDRTQRSLAQPEPGKALVYVFEEFQEQRGFVTPTIRVGQDGAWVGANQGSSYLSFAVEPGEHHLCANWQSSLSSLSSQYSLASFTAESGKIYCFKVTPRLEAFRDGGGAWSKDLAPVNADEAKYLINISTFSQSHPRK
jgi:hypothetical protein